MNGILLAALLYRATFAPLPVSYDLDVTYIRFGFDPKDCHGTDWGWWDMFKPIEAECNDGHGHRAHFDIDPEAL